MARDDHLPRPPLLGAEADDAVDLRHHRGVVRTPRLEELRDARQSPRDVAGLADVARDPRQHGSGDDLLRVVDHDVCAGRDDIRTDLPPLVVDFERRGERPVAGIDDDLLDVPCLFVVDLPECHVFFELMVFHGSGVLGDDHRVVRIPFVDDLALVHLCAIRQKHGGTVGHVVLRQHAVVLIENIHHAAAAENDDARTFFLFKFDEFQAFVLHCAVEFRLHAGL